MRKSPYRDAWEEIGDAALYNPIRFLILLVRQLFKEK